MDVAYLKETLGEVVAKGCAQTIAVAPPDPIHYLSLWLLKYVENATLIDDLQKENQSLSRLLAAKQEKQSQGECIRQGKLLKQTDRIAYLQSIQNDPYVLFDACVKAVVEFTGSTSAYVALVLDKPWEPSMNLPESENEGMPNDKDSEDEDEEKEGEEGSTGESNPLGGGNDIDERKEDAQEAPENHGEDQKRIKPLRPFKYKKKVLLYAAATSNNEFLLNKKLDRKTGPISFKVLLEGLPKLHVENVLYQQGMHFFEGLPLMGAYFTTPISMKETSQLIALLCADTLRKDHVGTGLPFTSDQQEFIAAVAQAATEALGILLPAASGNFRTKGIIKELEEVQNSLKEKEKFAKKKAKNDGTQGEQTSEGVPEEQKDTGERDQVERTESDHEEELKDGEEFDVDKEDADEENEDVAKNEDENAEEDEDQEEAEQLDDVEDSQREMRMIGKLLKKQQKKVANLQLHFQKCQTRLEKQAAKVTKLEKQLERSRGTLSHLCDLLSAVVDVISEHKEEVFGQIRQCLFPTSPIHRALKALLHVLGHGDAVVYDWTKSRKVLREDICKVMREYVLIRELDLKKWDLSDVFLDGLTAEQLSEEAPAGYLAHQWLLVAKKVAFETVKFSNYKAKSEKAIKEFADVELEQMVAEIDSRVAIDEEKKLTFQLENLQSKFAQELSKAPTNEEQEQSIEEEDGED